MTSLNKSENNVIIEGRKSIDLKKADKNAKVFGFTPEKGLMELRNISVLPVFSKIGPNVPAKRYSCGVVLRHNSLYVIGGTSESGAGSKATNDVFKLDLNKPKKWKTMKSMKEKRMDHAVALFKDKILSVGAQNTGNDSSLKSAEIYTPSKDEWSDLPDLNQRRGGHALVVCKDHAYALGGSNGSSKPHEEVERFKLDGNKWEVVSPMNSARDQLNAICLNDRIYAMGGCDAKYTTMSSVEVYDPDVDVWSTCASMLSVRCNFSSIILQNKIHIVGGWDECLKPLLDIDYYDPEVKEWKNTAEITDELLNCVFFACEA